MIPVAFGSVKWFNASSGYGYIVSDEGEKDLFVHRANVAPDVLAELAAGDRVEFERRDGGMGPQAINVEAITATVERLTDEVPARAPNRASGQELPDDLVWEEFLRRFFPDRRRHDFEALRAYAVYRSCAAAPPIAA